MYKIFAVLVFCLYFFVANGAYSQNKEVDSLVVKLEKLMQKKSYQKDTACLNAMNQLAYLVYNNKPDTTLKYAELAISYSTQLKYKKGIAEGKRAKGLYYYVTGNYPQALVFFQESIAVQEQLGYKEGVAANLNSIANVYHNETEYDKALAYFQKSLALREQLQDKQGIATCLNNIGNTYLTQHKDSIALSYIEKALNLRKEIKDERGQTISLTNMGKVYEELKNYKLAVDYYLQAYTLGKKINNKRGLSFPLNGLARVYRKQGQYHKAIAYAQEGLVYANHLKNLAEQKELYHTLYETYRQKGGFDTALFYHEKFELLEDTLFSVEKSQIINNLETKAEMALKDAALSQEKESKEFQQRINYLVLSLLLLSLFFGVMIWRNREKIQLANLHLQDANEEITTQNEEITQQREELAQTLSMVEQQKKEIEEKNQNIVGSISYALRIQKAIIPSERKLSSYLDCFVFFRPRDIVSGDFYWFAEKGNKRILAVADCTGHGVSGAFMTMIGNDILNQIVHDREIHEPHLILNELQDTLQKTFLQTEQALADGMDIAIISIVYPDLSESINFKPIILYAGAMNPIYIIPIHEQATAELPLLTEIKADKVPIGGLKKANFHYKLNGFGNVGLMPTTMESYQSLDLPTTYRYMLYLFSDGFQDQFGGEQKKKFMSSRLRKLLVEIAYLPMQEQKEIIAKTFDDWQGDLKQIDDVLLIGIAV